MSREPNRNVYVGHRYVPLILEEWDKKISYEGLSVVTHKGASYTSKKRVPVGIDILNKEFWSLTGNYNAQVDYYRQETERVAEDLLLKSDQTYVDTELGKKANQTYVDTELDKKTDQSYTDTELGKKADKSYTDTELGKKADKSYTDTELGKKADKTYVDTELDKKSNQTYVDTELDKKANQTDVDTELDLVNRDLIERGINVTLPPYNAKGDNVTDDTSAITQAINDLPNNGVLILPYNKVFRVSGIIVNKPLHILGGGTVKFINTKPLQDSVISCTSKVTVQDITVDGNVDNISEYEGLGVGLQNSGNGSKFINVKVNNTKFNAFSNREGSHVSYLECYSYNAGYGGFHNFNGDYINIDNCFAENFKLKGFVHNGKSKMINLTNFKAITDSMELAVDPVLIDGNGVQVEFLSLDNIYINGTNRSNALKIIDVDVSNINNLKAMSNNTLYGLHVYGEIGRVDIKNSYIVGRVDIKGGHKFTVDNTVIDAGKHIGQITTVASPLAYNGEYVNISNVDIIGGTSNAINIDAETLIKNIIKDVYYEGSNNLIGISQSGYLDRSIKQVEVNGYAFKNNNEVASASSLNNIRVITNTYRGQTADRPLNPETGQEYFDINLGYPIYWNGTAWVNAIGEEIV